MTWNRQRFAPYPDIEDESLARQRQDPFLLAIDQLLDNVPNEPCHEISGGQGLFGVSKQNPIPVNGPTGETVYLNRLRSVTGYRFIYHRIGDVFAAISPHPIDVFELVAADASQWVRLYLLMYYPCRSQKAPFGMTLTPWKDMDAFAQTICRLDFFGSMARDPDFPFGIPDIVTANQLIRKVSPELPGVFAGEIRQCLRKRIGKWIRSNPPLPPHIEIPASSPQPTDQTDESCLAFNRCSPPPVNFTV